MENKNPYLKKKQQQVEIEQRCELLLSFLVGFNPIEKYLSTGIISPVDESKEYLKPPPRFDSSPSFMNQKCHQKT